MRYEFELRGVSEFMGDLATAPVVLEAADLIAMNKSVLFVEAEAKGRVPRRTGRLFSSIAAEATPSRGRVGTSVSYARFVEFGTTPHEIAPVTAMALYWKGARHPVARVRHPGAKEEAYLGPALERSREAIIGFFKDAAQTLVEHLAGK